MNKRYNLARALLHAGDKNCPETEIHYKLLNEQKEFRGQYNVGMVNRAWKNSITAPFSALQTRDLAVNPNTNAALTVSTSIPEIQQALRPTSLAFRLPIQIVEASGVWVLPRLSQGAAASPLTELQVLSSDDPSVGATGGGPARLSVQVSLSKQLLAQAAGSESLDDVLKRDLARAIGQRVDFDLINGNGTVGTVNGLANMASATSNFAFGGPATWATYMGTQKQIETNFIDASSAIWLLGPSSAAKGRQALRGTSTAFYIIEDDHIGNIPVYVSSFAGVSEQAILADWTQVVIGVWGSLDFTVDFFTKASSGEVVLTALLYWNCYIRRPQSMVISTDSAAQ